MTAPYPPAPWQMVGQLWLTLFRLRTAIDELHPAGSYGVAFVSYQPGSPLTYSELLVARPVSTPTRAVTITDIWVDSPASEAGGRELWAIPKGLADFTGSGTRRAILDESSWSASIGGAPVARATFRDASRLAPRLPFRGVTWQPGLDDGIGAGGGDRTAVLAGRARTLPARARWDFAPDGPLSWLAQARQLASARMADFAMSFG